MYNEIMKILIRIETLENHFHSLLSKSIENIGLKSQYTDRLQGHNHGIS